MTITGRCTISDAYDPAIMDINWFMDRSNSREDIDVRITVETYLWEAGHPRPRIEYRQTIYQNEFPLAAGTNVDYTTVITVPHPRWSVFCWIINLNTGTTLEDRGYRKITVNNWAGLTGYCEGTHGPDTVTGGEWPGYGAASPNPPDSPMFQGRGSHGLWRPPDP
jgi:hypothetical protein